MSIKSIVRKHLLNEVRVKSSDRIKLYEDTEWVVIIPLTHKASCKYGHGSNWCTSTPSNGENFDNYNQKGILVYYINKNKSTKYAEFIDFNGEQQFFTKEDKVLDSFPEFLTKIQNQIKIDVFKLLKKKKDEVSSQIKNSPSLDWLNELWSEMVEFKSENYPQSTLYGKSKNDLYFDRDEKDKYFWIDYTRVWSKISNENQWTYQQTLNFFKYWLDEHLKLGYLTPWGSNGFSQFGLDEDLKLGYLTPTFCF